MAYSTRHVVELFILALVFHIVFSSSIFDCYFRSPVVHGMTHFGSHSGEAKRLVLIVGDGLRADVLFTPTGLLSNSFTQEAASPYLRSIVEERGAFGISHTRIPTETRPGHIAIIGGMHEDASEITKGWSGKPIEVNFDSVFNQTSHTFIFGAPDIPTMFADPSVLSNIRGWSYDVREQDYTKDASVLDTWVLDQFRTLLRNASHDPMLNSALREDKVAIFLHLLGVDSTGHSYRPHSKEYARGIRIVDDIVREAEKLISDFYGDDNTSFIFTADHGMTNIGNHGDGDPDSTRTPLILWGKGVRGPLPDSSPSSHDDYSRPWKLEHLLRRDISQADIAPIMATLLGVDWPVNSVGVLPDIDPTRAGFLNLGKGDEGLAHAALINTRVILEHYRLKHELKQENTLFYKPYVPLEDTIDSGVAIRVEKLACIEKLVGQGRWNDARTQAMHLIQSCLDGLRYLHTYDSLLIRSMVTLGYTGWAAYISIPLLSGPDTRVTWATWPLVVDAFALLIFFGAATTFWIQNFPGVFYLYLAFPCHFWRIFFLQGVPALVKVTSQSSFPLRRFCAYVLFIVASLWGMVAAYSHRQIWSVGFFIIGVVWPYCTWPSSTLSQNWRLVLQWNLSCTTTGIFLLLPVDKKETLSTILFGGTIMLVSGATYTWKSGPDLGFNGRRISALLQMSFIVAMMVVTFSSVRSLQAKNGLPSLNNLAAWTILLISSVYPFVSPVRYASPISKVTSFFLAFSVCFVVLSICDEGLFLSAFTCNLLLWIDVETTIRKPLEHHELGQKACGYQLQMDDVRIAVFFLFFTQIAFFGPGNIASISSFFLEPVYRLVTIYNPFLVLFLLMFKILIPFVMLSLALATLNARLRLPPFFLLFVALMIVDGMTLTFFFNVTDIGSWFDIGQSINAFCTASLLVVWSTGTCAIGGYLIRDTLAPLALSIDKPQVETKERVE